MSSSPVSPIPEDPNPPVVPVPAPTQGVSAATQVAIQDEVKPRRPKLYFFIEGINNNLRSIEGWHLWFEDMVLAMPGPDKANSYSYGTGPVLRWTTQGSNIKKAAEVIKRCWNKEIYDLALVGHSNGCPIICGLLMQYPELFDYVHQVHFYAPAADANFNSSNTGLNRAMANHQVGAMYINCSTSDSVLQIAKKTFFVRWFNKKWGYGQMGLTGPLGMTTIAEERTHVKFYPNYDHSTWFEGAANKAATFQELTQRVG